MKNASKEQANDRDIDEVLRRALATPPLSDDDILKRSKETHAKKRQSK